MYLHMRMYMHMCIYMLLHGYQTMPVPSPDSVRACHDPQLMAWPLQGNAYVSFESHDEAPRQA